MHACSIRPHNLKKLPNTFWSYTLTRWHTFYDSHYLTSRLTSHLKFIGPWIAYLQKMDRVYIDEPFMPALTKAFPFITDHYRTGIHTIPAVWTMLNIRYRDNVLTAYRLWRGIEFQLRTITPHIINRSWYMGSSSSRPLLELQRSARIIDGKIRLPQLTE